MSRSYEELLAEVNDMIGKAILGHEYTHYASTYGTYSNLYSGRPLTADDVRAMWESQRDRSIGHASGRVTGTGRWLLFAPLPSAEGQAALRCLALAFEAIVPMLQRRAIDDILREDARKHPAFAKARLSAVMAACEMWGMGDITVGSVHAMLGNWLHEYERLRKGGRAPSMAAMRHARATFGEYAAEAYERARHL